MNNSQDPITLASYAVTASSSILDLEGGKNLEDSSTREQLNRN